MKSKILVVDDEPLNCKLVEESLLKDYDVMTASSGMEALIKAEKIIPDLILLDIMMPNMNGYAVCKELKRNSKTKRIPVIMITALNKPEDTMNAIESGADDFMNKPIYISELEAKIKSWLKIKRQASCSPETSSNIHLYKIF